MNEFARFFVLLFFLSTGSVAFGEELQKKTICTWDPVGQNGPVMTFFSDFVPKALAWGLDIKFVAYEDERQTTLDLVSGKCDAAIVTAILSRDFVPFAGTLDAIGGITSELELRKILMAIALPKATELMSNEDYEVVASLPVGSMFAFVRDRRIDQISDFDRRRIAILNGDKQTYKFAELAGAEPVNETLSTFASSFNEGNVDIVIMPALAYNTFELYRGLGEDGGILDIKLFYGMLQTIAYKPSFPKDFGQKMRTHMVNKLNEILHIINNAERSIPNKYWIRTDSRAKEELELFYKDIRLALKVESKFDPKALSLLWKVRCSVAPERDECK